MTERRPMPYPQQMAAQVTSGYQLKRMKPFYKRFWFWALVIVGVVVIAVVTSVSAAVNDAVSKPHNVTYSITGTVSKVDLSYYNNDGSDRTTQKTIKHVSLPWSKRFTIKGDMSLVSVDATPSNLIGKGKLKCKLVIDHRVIATDEASGAGAMVDCTGTGYSAN